MAETTTPYAERHIERANAYEAAHGSGSGSDATFWAEITNLNGYSAALTARIDSGDATRAAFIDGSFLEYSAETCVWQVDDARWLLDEE